MESEIMFSSILVLLIVCHLEVLKQLVVVEQVGIMHSRNCHDEGEEPKEGKELGHFLFCFLFAAAKIRR